MSQVLDFFTSMLINMDDEEEYVNIGRILLSVERYTVCKEPSSDAIAQVPR
jgi:hypothetical protein